MFGTGLNPFRRDAHIERLAEVPLFSSCTTRQLEVIARNSIELVFRPGTKLAVEGKSGHECFILLEGEAEVTIGGRLVANIGPGDITGEMALLEKLPRSATVKALTPIRAMVMSRTDLNNVIEAVPAVARKMLRVMAGRLREVQAA